MKIAILSDNFYPELSGISDSIIALAKELAKLGHHIRFYVPKYSKKNFEIVNRPYQEINLGKNISIYRLPSIPFPGNTKQTRLVFPLGWAFKDLKKFAPDLIHTHLFFGVGIEALIASKLLKIPLIGTNHTNISAFIKHLPIKLPAINKLFLRCVSSYYNHCCFLSTPSQDLANEMKKYGLHGKIKILSNPIDLKSFKPASSRLKGKIKKKSPVHSPTIIYAGRLSPEKNINILLQAIAIVKQTIPKVTLAIAGHGTELTKLERLAKTLNLTNTVKFFGTLHQKKLSQFYQTADIFVNPSDAETQSLTLMQAMACELPVIGAKAKAFLEYIKDQETGLLIETKNSNELAKAILKLIKNPNLSKQLAKKAYQYVQQFSAKKIAAKWENLYKNILKCTIKNNENHKP